MARVKVEPGVRFNRLTVIERGPSNPCGNSRWWCRCDCGNKTLVSGCNLGNNHTTSCGCAFREIASAMKTKHGESHGIFAPNRASAEYTTWVSMLGRCYNPKNERFSDYGGRGIKVCRRWRESYIAFLADMGRRPSKRHSLDRINNERGYSPKNCRWATMKEQCRNTRRTHLIAYSGLRLSIAEWSERTGMPAGTILKRAQSGWPAAKIFETPVGYREIQVDFKGEKKSLRAWARHFGLRYGTVWARFRKGWAIEEVLEGQHGYDQ